MIEAIRYAHEKRNVELPVKHFGSDVHVFDYECYVECMKYVNAVERIRRNLLLYYFLCLIRWI